MPPAPKSATQLALQSPHMHVISLHVADGVRGPGYDRFNSLGHSLFPCSWIYLVNCHYNAPASPRKNCSRILTQAVCRHLRLRKQTEGGCDYLALYLKAAGAFFPSRPDVSFEFTVLNYADPSGSITSAGDTCAAHNTER